MQGLIKAHSLLRVCLIMRHFHPVLAGDSERFRRYAPGLRERGVEFVVVTSHSAPTLPWKETVPGGVQVHRVECIGPDGKFDDRLLFQKARQLLQSGEIEAEIVQTTLANTRILSELWKLRLAGYSLVHVSTMVGMEDPQTAALRAKFRHAVCLSPFHSLVVSSQQMLRWSAGLGAGKSRQEIITNGVDTTRFRPPQNSEERQRIRLELGLHVDSPVVLFVGNILPRKGLHLLLKAWHQVLCEYPTTRLVVVGPTSRPTVIHQTEKIAMAKYQDEIIALRDSLPLGSVVFAGERSDVEIFYWCSDIFILPSEQEGMGNVVLEAFASKLPCVLTDFVGLPNEEFGLDGSCFRKVPRESNAIASAILELLRSPETMEQMGGNALSRARESLSLKLTLDKYATLYKHLAKERG